MHIYNDVKDMLHDELAEIVKKGELSAGSLETIDKLLHSIKNADKIIMYERYSSDGYSNAADGNTMMDDYSYGRGRYAKRDSMGRYSRHGGYSYDDGGTNAEKISMLRSMIREVSSEDERKALQKIIHKLENE